VIENLIRPNIARMRGYVPGEQPRDRRYIKLNTNENPYPPPPAVAEALSKFDPALLRLYPPPIADELRDTAAEVFGFPDRRWILCGNGSDDLLTIAVRTFVDQNASLACPDPSYSLYPVLADIQGASVRRIALDDAFDLPDDAVDQAGDASLLFIARPNAPTGNAFPLDRMHALCRDFRGVVWIDEAYADFADDHCLDFPRQYPNVVVSRTLSKSYALAGIRLGLAFAQPDLIEQMLKVKDSYNVNTLTQVLAAAALREQSWLKTTVDRIRATCERVGGELRRLGFEVLPSQTNFLFVRPPIPAETYFRRLREEGVLVRWFSGPRTKDYVRITIGTDAEMDELLAATIRILED